MRKVAVFLLWALVAPSHSAPTESDTDDPSMKLVTRLFNDCGNQEDVSVCLKIKAVNFMDRLARAQGDIPINEFVSLSHTPNAAAILKNDTEKVSEESLEATLPRSISEKSAKLDEMMWNKLSTLLQTRTLQLSAPTEMFEGRGKKKGGHGKKGHGHMMMMGWMMAGMMMKMMMGKIAMMAGKAMVIGKIALVMAAVMGLKKMGGGGGESHPQVVYGVPEQHGGGGGGGWQRRYMDANHMAYSGQNPTADY